MWGKKIAYIIPIPYLPLTMLRFENRTDFLYLAVLACYKPAFTKMQTEKLIHFNLHRLL